MIRLTPTPPVNPAGKRYIEAHPDKDAAERRLADIIRSGKQGASKRLSFKDYADWWLENCAKGVIKHSTYQEYGAVLRNHVYPLLGSKPFAKVNRAMIRELIAVKKKEFSQSTIRNIMAPVRGMFFQAIEDGNAHLNPAARIGKLNKRSKDEQKKKIDPLTREEIHVMLKTAQGRKYAHWYPLFLCAPRTGIRQGELVSVKRYRHRLQWPLYLRAAKPIPGEDQRHKERQGAQGRYVNAIGRSAK